MGDRIYTTAELRSHTFFRAHEADIMAAMREGRIKKTETKTPASLKDWPALRREPTSPSTPLPTPPAPRAGSDFGRPA